MASTARTSHQRARFVKGGVTGEGAPVTSGFGPCSWLPSVLLRFSIGVDRVPFPFPLATRQDDPSLRHRRALLDPLPHLLLELGVGQQRLRAAVAGVPA